ncbi:sensor histidine kinase [Edaphocola aurantiacus]|uniref:sensor histidine kinase n=1 Tax=Edaphocola aurantiacus TaxID=2601682 RepID=UPI001C962E46|nr:ATP-binding protein [Edaphocola aurantiacus]
MFPSAATYRPCLRIVCLLFLFICLQYPLSAQTNQKDWTTLEQQYKQGKLSDTAYLNKAEALSESYLKEPDFPKYMTLYQKIAWGKKQYQPYRVKYYSILANHTSFTHQEGASLYYLQKSEQELQKTKPYFPSLNEPRFLLVVYGSNERLNIDKRKAVFINILPFLKQLPQLIRNQDVPVNTSLNAMTILNNVSRLYAREQDASMVRTIVDISGKIYQQLSFKNIADQGKLKQCLYLNYQVRYTAALMLKDINHAKSILDSSRTLVRTSDEIRQIWARSAERALIRKYIDFFIAQKQPDSSRYYMQLLAQKINKNDPGDGTAQLRYSATVNALDHHYAQAYTDLLGAYEINDSVIGLKMADINNNMYARLIAEEKQGEILQLKAQKQKRNIIVAIAALLAVSAIILLYLYMKRKDRNARKKIETLRQLTQIEIAELEIRANAIQKRLGMELHDDLAGQLASLGYFIELQLLDEQDHKQQERLETINLKVKNAYQNTRQKSHEWYTEGAKEEQDSFAESVQKLASYALPEQQFEKTIDIDNPSLQKVSHRIKIELLRIIQEAFINILKHSGAYKVQLFMYADEGMLSLQINDNGKGFDVYALPQTKSLGLQSLQNRIQDMNGTMAIESTKNGTALSVEVPLSQGK